MNNNLLADLINPDELNLDELLPPASVTERIIEFYEEAGPDYEHWSKGFNMHLGVYRRGASLFDREKMLEQMNLEVAARLQLNSKRAAFLMDLGCGTGAVARTVAKQYPSAIIKGVTLSPSQVKTATAINTSENLQKQIEILRCSYTALPFGDGTADGVWAVESACYAEGADKANLIREMARVLKIGGRFAVADCFIKQPERKFNFLIGKCYAAVCDYWAVPEMAVFEDFMTALRAEGFEDIFVEDISWQIAPSLAHAPFAVFSFIVQKILAGKSLNRQSVNNLKASLLALMLGLNRSKFSYCLISGKRR